MLMVKCGTMIIDQMIKIEDGETCQLELCIDDKGEIAMQYIGKKHKI
jgi:hypothetical protein